ncbi:MULTISPECIES: aminoacyl-tRNA hydrolase [unclassified Thioalkalivibrio]|uniref:aminoacyl-tRNA hydrolase n=1 Tax=unclassified Thioalkalivibrio TaxID=2621013 RepID=UPI00035E178E|nr:MULTISPECIES: aminoacyl-tRNA hydrolase [unclassified Thioalkalivibrio]
MAIRLIVGLGNPGPRYAETRHNAGFWFVDALARRHSTEFRSEGRFDGEVARLTLPEGDCWLFKPMSFMNKSGLPVRKCADFYRIAPEEILVVHDELDLDPGVARLKMGGGHGGHNGLRDLHRHMGGPNYARLRLGIGHPGHRDDVVPFVLDRPGRDDARAIEDAIDAALDQVPALIAGRWDEAVRNLHGGGSKAARATSEETP